MSRVLLVNEFGSGLGHINRLVAVAKRLQADHTIVFALPQSTSISAVVSRAFGNQALLKSGVEWLAPTDPRARLIATHTLADVIRLFRFDDKNTLQRAVKSWRALIDEVKPELIVADFAPTLRIAVGTSIPTIVVGNGYTVPPRGRVLPPIRPWQLNVPVESLDGERTLLTVINDVATESGTPAIDYVADLFSGIQTFIGTITEFDPYHAYRTEPVKWPFNVPFVKPGLPTAARSGPAIFVYLPASHPLLMNVINAVNHLNYKTHIYISGADPQEIARRCARHVGVLVKPADFSDALPRTRLLIHHAGLGTAYAGLAAGTPQLLLPLNLEHLITSRGLTAEGTALGFTRPPPSAPELSGAVQALLTEPAWMGRAATRATALALLKDPDPLADVISACKRLITTKSS